MEIREAQPDDVAGLDAMLARCSRASICRRFHGCRHAPPGAELGAGALLAVARGQVIAVGEERGGELGLLVEDDWQRRGVGTALLHALLARCHGAVADVQFDNRAAIVLCRRAGGVGRLQDGGVRFHFS